MEATQSVATLIDSTTSKIQQLQKAFAELESHRAVTLNLKWKELEEHFHGLEKSLKRRFHELEDQEKDFETKTAEARVLLEKKQADILAKEEASLEKLQEKRDAAVFTITSAREKHRKVSPLEPVIVNIESHGEDSNTNTEETAQSGITCDGSSEEISSPENGNEEEEVNSFSSSSSSSSSSSYPQLVKLCEQMDTEGLHKFISDNRKNLAAIRDEIPYALKAAASPAFFVLDSLEDFYRDEAANVDGKKDSYLIGVRRSCIMLMECLSTLLESMDSVSTSEIITEEVKDQAKEIAEEWKPKLDGLDLDDSNGNSLEAHAFLQLLATFCVASDFDEDELSRLVPMVSRRRQTADLCRSLGLSEKMPGVIEVLINSGRQIDAVNLAFAFELTEQFSPVVLLKSYLKEARKTSSPTKPGTTSPTVQFEVNERELTALKAVVKCIEDHKLEGQFPVDPLQKQVVQMEKAKADKKRVTEPTKPQPKRPRASGVGPRIANIAPPASVSASDKSFYPRVVDNRYPQYVYERPYVYAGPTENHCPTMMGSAAYSLSPAHGNYFPNGYQYPTAYLH